MRTLVLALLIAGVVYSSPLEKAKRASDVELVLPVEDDADDDDSMFTGMDGKGFMTPNLSDFLNQFTEFANRVSQFFNRPFFGPGGFGEGFGGVDNLPPNYDNSTFSTKVVNGSIITVNETIKKQQNNDSSFVWKVKVVQIRPENATSDSDDDVEDVEEESEFVSITTPEGQNPDSDNDVAPVPKVVRRMAQSNKMKRSQV